MSIPIIRLEIEGMKRTVITALSDYKIEWDEMVKKSVESYCSEENIRNVINEAVRIEIDKVIKDAVHEYYNYGNEGSKIISDIVIKKLRKIKRGLSMDNKTIDKVIEIIESMFPYEVVMPNQVKIDTLDKDWLKVKIEQLRKPLK